MLSQTIKELNIGQKMWAMSANRVTEKGHSLSIKVRKKKAKTIRQISPTPP